MKPPVMLCYNLQGDRAAKITLAAMRFAIRIRVVKPEEYTQTIAALCGFEPLAEQTYQGEPFSDELLLFANFPNGLATQFLSAMRRAKLAPVRLKAVLTPTNSAWTSLQLHAELSQEDEAMRKHEQSVHEGNGGR